MNTKEEKLNEIKTMVEQHKEMYEAIIYFIKRVREGSIRSKTTYQKYVAIIEKIKGKKIKEILNDE